MAPAADNTGAFTVSLMTFRPGIRGIQRSFKLRSITSQGRLWLLAKDAAKALGTPINSFRQRCQIGLEGAGWGYAILPDTSGRPAMMMLVALDELTRLLIGSRTRRGRMFRRWLSSIPHPQTVL
jgi:prophage antirepressor-like protein